jgi:DNA repair exonuclease SbcCD ATPase subunit
MLSLKPKQLLLKAAKLSQKEEKISGREIEKKINQIKYLTSIKKIPKTALRKEITRLEKHLKSVFLLEKKLKENEKEKSKEITALKKQLRELRQKISVSKDATLTKKIEKISHLLGDLMAKETAKKEVRFEETKRKIEEKFSQKPAPVLTLKKIDELQEKIIILKKSGKCPPEKIAQLKRRLSILETKLPIRTISRKNTIKHRMLFGPLAEEVSSVSKLLSPILPKTKKKGRP